MFPSAKPLQAHSVAAPPAAAGELHRPPGAQGPQEEAEEQDGTRPVCHPPHCWGWAAQNRDLICPPCRIRKALNYKQEVQLAALCLSTNVTTPLQPSSLSKSKSQHLKDVYLKLRYQGFY